MCRAYANNTSTLSLWLRLVPFDIPSQLSLRELQLLLGHAESMMANMLFWHSELGTHSDWLDQQR